MVFAFGVGVAGGVYGIGGGSLLSPVLVTRGIPAADVAPAALVSTLLTSVVAYVTLAAVNPTLQVAPNWTVGIVAGIGGLFGGYLGALLQPVIPERPLTTTLGLVSIATSVIYFAHAI